ncbi:MAG: hypothetical protein ACREQX_12420 [Candidatus Binataceae bacterium]
MNRDFEFKQLLRAYRSGIISEETFESEMAQLENGGASAANGHGGGFRAFDKTYNSERDAIVSFIDKVRVAESNAGIAFAKWVKVCRTECVRSGLRMIAERESYHGRVFEARLRDLGAECRAQASEESLKFADYAADPDRADSEKLMHISSLVGDTKKAIQPIRDFAELIKQDLETKEMLRLFAEDELSSTTWLRDSSAALNADVTDVAARDATAQPAAN